MGDLVADMFSQDGTTFKSDSYNQEGKFEPGYSWAHSVLVYKTEKHVRWDDGERYVCGDSFFSLDPYTLERTMFHDKSTFLGFLD